MMKFFSVIQPLLPILIVIIGNINTVECDINWKYPSYNIRLRTTRSAEFSAKNVTDLQSNGSSTPTLSKSSMIKDSQSTLFSSNQNHNNSSDRNDSISSSLLSSSSVASIINNNNDNKVSSSSTSSSTTTSTTLSANFFNRLIEQSIVKTFEKRYRNCPSLRNALRNGKVKQSSYPNRVARFSCNKGFDLIGNRYSTCSRNRWTHDLPVCVSTYCPIKFNAQPPLMIRKISNHSSVIDLSCELGYRLLVNKKSKYHFDVDHRTLSSYVASSIRAYCISKQWLIDDWDLPDHSYSSSLVPLDQWPTCEIYDRPSERSMNCTFESSYGAICGWMQDKDDDFDWTRNFLTTLSHYDNTGPSYDHTYGENKTGYYLYLESSYPQAPNDVARLYSPVFRHAENASIACFQFYYHMYGKAIGSLRIYVKEKFQRFNDLEPVWEMSGDQGDQWLAGQIEIQPSSSSKLQPFQIIIEGILGNGHQGDIAIDDLLLTLGQSCSMITNSSVEVINETLINDLETTLAPSLGNNSSQLPNPSKWYSSDDDDSDDGGGDIDSSSINDTLPHNEIYRSIFHLKPLITPTPWTARSISLSTTSVRPTVESKFPTATKVSATPASATPASTTTTTTPASTKKTTPSSSSMATKFAKMTIAPRIETNVTSKSMNESTIEPIQAKNIIENEQQNKPHNSHWIIIMFTILTLLLFLMIIIYIINNNLSLHKQSSSQSNYGFVALFINRCNQLFQTPSTVSSLRNKNDDSELLMVNDDYDGGDDASGFHDHRSVQQQRQQQQQQQQHQQTHTNSLQF